jgi:hypothetical protein
MKKLSLYIIIILCIAFFYGEAQAQHNQLQRKLNSGDKVRTESFILDEIEKAISSGDVNKVSVYFSSQPYLSFLSGINGYYSSNQAYYILEEFFKEYRVISFAFENRKIEESVCYGTGLYAYEREGKRESAHLYVTLNKVGSKWYITQISAN